MKLENPKRGKRYRIYFLVAILSLLALMVREWPDIKQGWADGAADAIHQEAPEHRK